MLEKLNSLKGKFRYNDSEMPFLEHLEEFRKMVIRCFIALGVGMLICLPFADHLIGVLRAPAEPYIIENSVADALDDSSLRIQIPEEALAEDPEGKRYYDVDADVIVPGGGKGNKGVIRLQFSEPAAAIKMWLTVTFFGGILLSLPLLVFFIGMFVMPGVKDLERKAMTRIAAFSGGLFLLGIAMGYKVTLPLALGLMIKIGGQLGGESIWFYNKYISFALQLLLGFGIAFQLPVVILILGKMGLVNSTQLREKRRHVIVALLILAMLLTPPDVMTQLLMAAPLILLYEFCIWFLYFSGNRGVPAPEESAADEQEPDEVNDDATKDPSEE
ncbi:MAG: twin-arginine translocase subunit TatC [Pontiella sp.]|nr:twin-arginine translocase subunit TatC [Pontiella sp.]